MRKPSFSGYLNGWDDRIEVTQIKDGDRVVTGHDGLPLISARAKGFELHLCPDCDGPRVVVEYISDLTTDIVLLDAEEGGDTFCLFDAAELKPYYEEIQDEDEPDFEPKVGLRCVLTYAEVTAMIEGLQRVAIRMEHARKAKEMAKLEQQAAQVESFERPREVQRVGNQPYKLPEVAHEAR